MFGWSRRGAGMLLAAMICAVLAGGGSASTASAQTVIDYDADNDGLIEVTTEDQLSAIRWDLDGSGVVEVATNATTYAAAFPTPATGMGCPATGCAGYELAADISLTSTGVGWAPIGDSTTAFTATFEGNGHTISDLFINRTTNNIGLFGATGSASAIRNVKLTSVDVTGNDNVGALVGLNGDATNGGGRIDNCEAAGTVTGVSAVGGLVGSNYGPISGSSASVAVTATRIDGSALAGGLVGRNDTATISDSHASGNVTGSHNSVGGLVGWNNGPISDSDALNPSVTGVSYVGGLVGQNDGAAGAAGSNAISGSTASGTVTATGSFAGGLVGWNNGPISDSDALNPSVTGVSYVGGLVGQNDGADGAAGSNAISGSTASGTVTATGSFAGGLVGSNEGPISDSDALNPSVTGLNWVGGLVGFNANAWSISGSTARGPVTASGSPAGGLVGQNTGPISGSSATGTVTGRTWVGGLVGLNNGPISDSSALNPSVTGAAHVGGLVGSNSNTIDRSIATANVTGIPAQAMLPSNTGGLVGLNASPIRDSYASGAVQGNNHHIGGLVGQNTADGLVINSRADGAVSVTGVTNSGTGDHMGGLVGDNLGSVTGSVATGAVTGAAHSDRVGGLVGHSRGSISGGAATGAVSGGQQVGGLVGYGANVASITESWASGAVTAIADASVGGSGSDVGGLVGWNDGPLGASFATGNVTGVGSAGGLLGRNTGAVVAAYATGHVTVSAHVSCPSNSCASVAGGLIGIAVKNLGFSNSTASNVQASYSTGSVSGPSTHVVGGLAGTAQREDAPLENNSAVFTNNYWDTQTSERPIGAGSDDEDGNGMIDGTETATAGVTGQTTTALKAPTDYTGIFAAWNVTVPMATARTGGPWVFGAATDYPVLRGLGAPPSVPAGTATLSVAEERSAGTPIGSPLTATDADSSTLSYKLVGADGSYFGINGMTGQLSTKTLLDYENPVDGDRDNTYELMVQASDGMTVAFWTVSVTLTNVNEAPTISGPATINVDEGHTGTLGMYGTDDPELSLTNWGFIGDNSALSGPDSDFFRFDKETGQLTFAAPPDFEGVGGQGVGGQYEVTVNTNDGELHGMLEVTVNVADVEEPGTLTFEQRQPVVGQPLTATLTEPDGVVGAVTWTWTWQRSPSRTGGGTEIATAPSRSYTPVTDDVGHYLTATATYEDGYGLGEMLQAVTEFTTAAANSMNAAPMLPDSVDAIELPENARPGMDAGSPVQATDSDPITYSLTGDSEFLIDQRTGQIKVAPDAAFDFDAGQRRYSVTVTASDGFGASDTVGVTITITNVDEPPVAADDAPLGFDEDTAATIDVLANDSDPEDAKSALTVSVVRGPARGMVVVNDAVDPDEPTITYEPNDDYNGADSFSYRVSDPGGLTSNVATVVLTIYALNDAPEFPATTTTARSVSERAQHGDPVGAPVTAVDVDGDDLTYSLAGSSSFEMLDGTAQITVREGAVLNATNEPTHMVTVTAADEVRDTASIDVTITVTTGPVIPPNNAPTFASPAAARPVPEDATGGALVGARVTATDSDAGDILTYRLSGADASSFVIDSNGQITVAAGVTFNMAMKPTYTVTVTAADEAGATASIEVTITVTTGPVIPPNNAPTFASPAAARSVPEDATGDALVGAPVTATDSDPEDTLTYSLSGTDASSFVIDSNGQITVAAGVTFNMAMKPTYTVTVTAADEAGATASIDVTITVTTGPVIPPVVIPPSGGGAVGGAGGGGGGGGGRSPSVIDFEWTVKHDIDELGSGHDTPSGLWSDGTTLWVLENGDGADDAIYAYDLASGERVEDREFELDGTNRAPRGVWSDGTTMWVSDSGRNRLFAHDLASGERAEERDIALAGRNRDARGIWSGDETMWVLDGGKDSLFAYDLGSGELLAEYELASTNGDPHGIWSDGVSVWVSDHGAKRLFAYRLPAPEGPAAEDAEPQGLERVSDEEFKELSKASNNSPRGLWSDGDVMYVADASDGKVYSYNMPDAIDARLASLSLSGVDIGEFSSSQTEYTGTAADGTTETTVTAEALQPRTDVDIDPPDADEEADGYQVALEDLGEITVTVTSADGSRKKTYRVRLGQEEVAGPAPDCLRGDVAVGFSLVVYAGGSVEDLVACAEGRNVTALYALEGGEYVSYTLGAPEFVNEDFRALFADGVPALTPLTVKSEGPATAAPLASAVTGPWAACLQGEIVEGFNLVVYEGGSVDDLDACARGRGVSAVYTLNEGEYVSYILGAPEFVNQSFAGLFADGVPSVTPLVVKRDGP